MKASTNRTVAGILIVGMLASVVLAGFVSFYASSSPTVWNPSPLSRASMTPHRTRPPPIRHWLTTASKASKTIVGRAEWPESLESASRRWSHSGCSCSCRPDPVPRALGRVNLIRRPSIPVGDQPAGHDVGERLYVAGDSVIHRLPAHVKVLAALATVLVIVLTPPQPPWVFAGYAAALAAALRIAGVGWRTVAPRLVIEVPFIMFALLLPFVGRGPEVMVGPLELSEPGLWASWNILAKATLGLVVSVLLAATTSTRDLIAGLQKLRVPDVLVQIFASMVRYVHVVTGEWDRMSRARAARGFQARGPRSWPVVAQGLGTLFIRSYERGERVHLAMVSRGYAGHLPDLGSAASVTGRDWVVALALPATVAVLALASWGWAR